ncbi:DUF397 domain-containing protein [Lentzea alba]|uniref:DUF397 domain-containing protein n=1 Tax=Lentzea alba TaxID=2714351 RepID=UPI0039BFF713
MDGAGCTWVKSSASGPVTNSQSCVEFTSKADGDVLVRTSRDREGGRLRFRESSWAMFIAVVKGI